jgi:hypothetical protein
VTGDEADIILIARATGDSGNHLATDDDRSGCVAVTQPGIGDGRVPHALPGSRIDGDDVGVVGGSENLVAEDGDVSLNPPAGIAGGCGGRSLRKPRDGRLLGPSTSQAVAPWRRGGIRGFRSILPNQIACGRIERLNHTLRVWQIHHAVVDERHGLLRAGVVHRPRPGELKLLHVLPVDLIERTVTPGVIRTPPVQPVANRWISQHDFRHGTEVLDLRSDPEVARQNNDEHRNSHSSSHDLPPRALRSKRESHQRVVRARAGRDDDELAA